MDKAIIIKGTNLAENEGFEPSIGFPIHAFQACALDRYANSPTSRVPPKLVPTMVDTEPVRADRLGNMDARLTLENRVLP